MSRDVLRVPVHTILLSVALFAITLVATAGLARAQGTPEQRWACTPDALRLCSDTIPDIGRTTACMKAHQQALSPGCRAAFAAAAPAPSSARAKGREAARSLSTRVAARASSQRVAGLPAHPIHRRHRVAAYGGLGGYGGGMQQARAIMGQLCGSALLDAQACSLAGAALNMAW